jgi:hypothetical protein
MALARKPGGASDHDPFSIVPECGIVNALIPESGTRRGRKPPGRGRAAGASDNDAALAAS